MFVVSPLSDVHVILKYQAFYCDVIWFSYDADRTIDVLLLRLNKYGLVFRQMPSIERSSP